MLYSGDDGGDPECSGSVFIFNYKSLNWLYYTLLLLLYNKVTYYYVMLPYLTLFIYFIIINGDV